VRLVRVEGYRLFIRNVDIIDGTPLLDIKPYVSEIDTREEVMVGWFAKHRYKLQEAKKFRR
jgi:tRNA (Thr-GGU) A37 N-methylase